MALFGLRPLGLPLVRDGGNPPGTLGYTTVFGVRMEKAQSPESYVSVLVEEISDWWSMIWLLLGFGLVPVPLLYVAFGIRTETLIAVPLAAATSALFALTWPPLARWRELRGKARRLAVLSELKDDTTTIAAEAEILGNSKFYPQFRGWGIHRRRAALFEAWRSARGYAVRHHPEVRDLLNQRRARRP
ncbi:MAG: hypothetical protein V2J26_04935 [Pacificimonas sp.]|jgi:hypothetical protein|nr:hypothetical protein [Pacificimonas sp.]